MGYLFNYKNMIEEALGHPFEESSFVFLDREYLYKCRYTYNEDSLKGIIQCNDKNDRKECGFVKVVINIDERCANFSLLEVVFDKHRNGIGTCLMSIVFDTIRVIKDIYSIGSEFEVRGWLSQEDNNDLHWGRSIPFYERLGKMENVDAYFYIFNTGSCVKTAKEYFKLIGNSDGQIIYFV